MMSSSPNDCREVTGRGETHISVRGKQVRVPRVEVEGCDIIVEGKWLRVAGVRDEFYAAGEPVLNPEKLIEELKSRRVPADIFTFSERISNLWQTYPYRSQPDNVAALPIVSYSQWWDSLSQETRRNVRLGAKRGLECRVIPFTDELVEGIREIYNEAPFRQGRRFWHYGKDFETVRRDNSTYLERSRFIGAYRGAELVGFIKMVYVDGWSGIMQILAKANGQHLRPTNSLIAKAVEVCATEGRSHLVYCKYRYHKGYNDPLTEFKRRNGFQEILLRRYFVPLTRKGRLAMAFKLHLGLPELLPAWLVNALLETRKRTNEYQQARQSSRSDKSEQKLTARQTASASRAKTT